MANNKDFKIKNAVKAQTYYENVGTVTAATVENVGPAGVFSADAYTGGAAQKIINDIDFSTDGGLVWIKRRTGAGYSHQLFDTERTDTGTDTPKRLSTDSSSADAVYFSSGEWDWLTNGFDLNNTDANLNGSGGDYVAWSFKKESSFFNVVTWTGDGTSPRSITHSLGSTPAFIIVKRTDSTSNWPTWHKDITTNYYLKLNTNEGEISDSQTKPPISNVTSTTFDVRADTSGSNQHTNISNATYVAYIFAHDTSDDSNIKCGSYTGTGVYFGPIVDLGWKPQWLMIKRINGNADWFILDTARGLVDGNDKHLRANTTAAEVTSDNSVDLIDTGFQVVADGNESSLNNSGSNYIYIAIREASTSNVRNLDLSTGSVFDLTPTADTKIGLSNPAASGSLSSATLVLKGAAYPSYDIANASYDSKSFSVTSQDTVPTGVFFNTDGTKMYVTGSTNDTVYQYTLSTAWDVSTASYDSKSFSVASQEASPNGLFITSEGTKMFVTGFSNAVYQYTLSTAGDISSASYDSVSLDTSSQDTSTTGLTFNTDGTKLYISGTSTDSIYEYALTTGFDLSTASYNNASLDISSQDTNPQGLDFNSDGTKLFVIGNSNDNVLQYTLSTAFDLSTASYDSVSFSVASQDGNSTTLRFGNSGTKLYMIGNTNDTIYQYTTGSTATITYDSSISFISGNPTSPAIGETDVLTFSTLDGGSSYSGSLKIDGAK